MPNRPCRPPPMEERCYPSVARLSAPNFTPFQNPAYSTAQADMGKQYPNDISVLMSHLQLCLAHYCDLHGPTPLMVTEGVPVPCGDCCDRDLPYASSGAEDRPRTSAAQSSSMSPAQTAVITDTLRKMNLNAHRSSSVPASEQEAQTNRAALLRSSTATSTSRTSTSAIETPPDSPHRYTDPQQQAVRRDSGFRKTYDEYVTKRASPCENCALTLPRRQESNGMGDLNSDLRGPTLRTRAPYAKVYGSGGQTSPPTSQGSSPSDTDGEGQESQRRSHRRATASTASRSSVSSSGQVASHTHFLDYTSTHEPLQAKSFSTVRASCLRTLSFETLPRAPSTATPSPSPKSTNLPAFVTTHSAGSAASGGPIFFGDALAGYTTAYIFRIPDVHARGHKRVYAFLALSTHRERLAMKTFGFIAAAFRDLAAWIQQLAEAEAERAAEASPIGGIGGYSSFPSVQTSQDRDGGDRSSGSSFLTGGSGFVRRMGGGGSGVSLKARGLAELVGLPDFFIQLHSRFVRLLLELGVMLSS
jgi:hypothetical protein